VSVQEFQDLLFLYSAVRNEVNKVQRYNQKGLVLFLLSICLAMLSSALVAATINFQVTCPADYATGQSFTCDVSTANPLPASGLVGLTFSVNAAGAPVTVAIPVGTETSGGGVYGFFTTTPITTVGTVIARITVTPSSSQSSILLQLTGIFAGLGDDTEMSTPSELIFPQRTINQQSPQVCPPGNYRCTSGAREQCNIGGTAWVAAACQPSETCTGAGICQASFICGAGEMRCNAGVREVCSTPRTAWVVSPCSGTETCTGAGVCAVTEISNLCGNRIADAGEECEITINPTRSCNNAAGYAGTQSCSNCQFNNACSITERCGDGVRNGPEACDGVDLASQTCITQGFTSGTLGCTSACAFDTRVCSSAGGSGGGGGEYEICAEGVAHAPVNYPLRSAVTAGRITHVVRGKCTTLFTDIQEALEENNISLLQRISRIANRLRAYVTAEGIN